MALNKIHDERLNILSVCDEVFRHSFRWFGMTQSLDEHRRATMNTIFHCHMNSHK